MSAPSRSEGPSWVRGEALFELPIVLTGLPSEVPFGFLGRLLSTTERTRMDLQAFRIPREPSLALLETAGAIADAELTAGTPADGARRSDLELESDGAKALALRVSSGEQELYRVGVSFRTVGPSRGRAERLRAELARRFQSIGFRTRIPSYEAVEAVAPPNLLGTERRPTGYWHTLSTDGLAAFFPFLDEAVVEPGGILVGLLLDDASPVVLDRWSQSSYSWGLFGSTGSGKSFAASLIALRSRWMRPEVELFVLDPLGEFAPLAEALGGDVVRLGSPGGPHLNPLDPGGAAEGWTDKAGRIGSFLRTLFPSLTDVESATLDGALASIGSDRARPPILSDLVQAVAARRGAPPRLATLLEVFRTGSLAYLDGPSTLTWEGRPIVFDLSNVLEAHLPFHLAYLLDAIYARLQRSPKPKLVVVDEAHLLARHPGTAEFLDRLVRHVRHFGSGLLIVSQNPDDFLGSEAGRSLLRNLRATVLLHLAEVSQATRAFFGLTEAEAEWLPRARLPKEAGYSEGLLRLGPAHLPMAIVASTPEYELLTGRPIGPGE